MDTTGTYSCPYCGEESVTEVDILQGMAQRVIEVQGARLRTLAERPVQ